MPSWHLPWPPVTTNHLYRRKRGGQVYLSEKAELYRDEVIVTIRQAGAVLPEGLLAMTIHLWAPRDGRRHDIDNTLKLLWDSVFAACQADDVRVAELHVYRDVGRPFPCVDVQIAPALAAVGVGVADGS